MTFDILKYLCFGCSKCEGSGYTLHFHTRHHYGALVKGDSIYYYWYVHSSALISYKTVISTIANPDKLIRILCYILGSSSLPLLWSTQSRDLASFCNILNSVQEYKSYLSYFRQQFPHS